MEKALNPLYTYLRPYLLAIVPFGSNIIILLANRYLSLENIEIIRGVNAVTVSG